MKILSLGAGVQSSTIFMMACYDEIERPDAAVFADTGWEPKAVYEWLGWLMKQGVIYGIPVTIVQQGNVKKDALISQVRGIKAEGKRWASLPLYTSKLWNSGDILELNKLIEARRLVGDETSRYETILAGVELNGEYLQAGMIRRQCTYEYKIRPLEKEFRRLAGYKKYARIPIGTVETWKGISMDEANRVSMSRVKWVTFYYPLIDLRMRRSDCLYWFKKRGLPQPPRSACIGCPYHNNNEWRHLRDTSPDEWQDAVEFDKAIRKCGGMRGDVFIHAARIPLDEINLDKGKNQLKLFNFDDECAGVCGV